MRGAGPMSDLSRSMTRDCSAARGGEVGRSFEEIAASKDDLPCVDEREARIGNVAI